MPASLGKALHRTNEQCAQGQEHNKTSKNGNCQGYQQHVAGIAEHGISQRLFFHHQFKRAVSLLHRPEHADVAVTTHDQRIQRIGDRAHCLNATGRRQLHMTGHLSRHGLCGQHPSCPVATHNHQFGLRQGQKLVANIVGNIFIAKSLKSQRGRFTGDELVGQPGQPEVCNRGQKYEDFSEHDHQHCKDQQFS